MFFNELVDSYERERRERNIFHDLMRYHVREVLLVASLYDSFILESDGALSEQIYGEYYKLNLSTSPRVTCAYTGESALDLCGKTDFDMVILMAGLDFDAPLAIAAEIRARMEDLPILLLAMNNASLSGLGTECPASFLNVDRVFVWNGYSKLFVGMIKYVEDMFNVDNDTRVGLVRVILLIEDSVKYYSRYLPLLYSVVMKQTQQLVEDESQVESYKILRMRGRPKIILATNYNEALELYERYEPYLLTVISDVRFPRDGSEDAEAGFEFLRMTKARKPDLPVLIQSSEAQNRELAYELGASFADKNSNALAMELTRFFLDHLGFGPFVFRDPEGAVLARASTMQEFERLIRSVPPESISYHAARNHFSAWLMARGEVRFARIIRNYAPEDFDTASAMRDFMCRALDDLRKAKSRGLIPEMGHFRPDAELGRLGAGSVGGKGRGLAFIKSLIDNLAFSSNLEENITIRLPPTVFIGIDEFERFMDRNSLWSYAWDVGGEQVRQTFLNQELDPALVERLRSFLVQSHKPLAIRSSGLFEDMLMVPFSGVYDTYIIPNVHTSLEKRLSQLCDAIRLVYASLFSETAGAYFNVAHYKREEERMAIVIQELVGSRHGRWFYPLISGTAQSYNYYPVAYLKPDEGLCSAALGLGSYVVDGGQAFRFSPRYPKLEVLAPEYRMSGTQRWFYALDMDRAEFDLRAGEEATLERLDIADAESNPRFGLIASTWNPSDNRLDPGISAQGPRIVDFAPVLRYDAFPFAKIVEGVLEVCSRSMAVPVEIEYALDFSGDEAVFYMLQVKPLIQNADKVSVDLSNIAADQCILATDHCMGNGRIANIRDIVYVDPATFDRAGTEAIAQEIGRLNAALKQTDSPYILIGPGRWGTRDRWLGIPVSFEQISGAKVIVEADLADFRVDSSLGSHFFHNVTAMNIGYFSVPFSGSDSFINWEILAGMSQAERTPHCVHIHFDEPCEVLMDGLKGQGLIKKPAVQLTPGPNSDNMCTY